ncbi:deoxynucleotidyltransferase terminal-interacting protein 2 [Hippocampus zosterae]|uniref:deoxynucleotidyltransferase terminal-interacting protein 2 n=1 Tax=Hippocampus zosterae TaxID=109293 RepID=UPI00223CEEFA|nr:deoxynucleotidyltransferase terminal-interacting protein 2 [Hippocampus zosterae]
MVATRSGARGCSPTKTKLEQASDVQATPSRGRRTRSTASQTENSTQPVLVETSKRHGGESSNPLKRCSRASRLHSPEQPCTPVGSIHEADVSDLESCCSAVSDVVLPPTRRRAVSRVGQEESEVESCSSKNVRSSKRRAPNKKVESSSSVVSDSDPPATRSRRSKRLGVTLNYAEEVSEADTSSSFVSVHKTVRNTRSRAAPDKAANDKEDSCSSPPIKSQRVTRSQRKRTRSSPRPRPEESELSEAESLASNVSGASVSYSSIRKSARLRKKMSPIPLNLDETSESSSNSRRRRTTRQTVGEKSCDSEGFESGYEYAIGTPSRVKNRSPSSKSAESDSDPTDGHFALGSACSSRTGSGSAWRVQSTPIKDLRVVLESSLQGNVPSDSMLDSTVIAEDADRTLLAEFEQVNAMSVEAVVNQVGQDGEEVLVEAAVATAGQQGEPSAEKLEGDVSAVEEMEGEMGPSPSGARCEDVDADDEEDENVRAEVSRDDHGVDSGTREEEEDMEVEQVTRREAIAESGKEEEGDDIGERKPKEAVASVDEQVTPDQFPPEGTEATDKTSTSSPVASREEDMEGTRGLSGKPEEATVTVVEQTTLKKSPLKDMKATKATKRVSLLESSEDEEEEEDEEEDQEDEDTGDRPGPCRKPRKEAVALESVDGLFMVDTRAGQEADKDYYMERLTQENVVGAKQEEEDFVDEEGDEDDDDCEEEALLLSTRNPLLKEMSTRIDPGINVRRLGGLYITFDGSKSKPGSSSVGRHKEKKDQDEVMKKSVMGSDFEKKDAVPPYSESKQALKKKRRLEREKTTGDAWFNMKAPELTKELTGDLKLLKMRGSMDPKRFYKKNDRDGFPKYFQVATVEDNPIDFYHSRIPKKQRKRTMVEELLADAEFRSNNKKKYQKIVAEKAAQASGKHKKHNKFHKKSKKGAK